MYSDVLSVFLANEEAFQVVRGLTAENDGGGHVSFLREAQAKQSIITCQHNW
jgi:hypothetical protein